MQEMEYCQRPKQIEVVRILQSQMHKVRGPDVSGDRTIQTWSSPAADSPAAGTAYTHKREFGVQFLLHIYKCHTASQLGGRESKQLREPRELCPVEGTVVDPARKDLGPGTV